MKIDRFLAFSLASLVLAGCVTPPPDASKSSLSTEIAAPERVELDTKAPIWLDEQNVPSMAVAVIGPTGTEWTAVYGERAPGEPATDETLYNIASLTKPLAAEALLAAVRDNRLPLDAPIADVYMDPDIENDPRVRDLTLRHLLSHRSGFPGNWRRMMDSGKLQIAWEPGTKAQYSGENYELAARYAEAALGKTIDNIARETVFEDAGISNIWFRVASSLEGRIAMVRGEDGTLRLPDQSEAASAADNAHATIGDYARFVNYAKDGSRLSTELQKARDTIYDNQAEQVCPKGVIPPELCASAAGHGLGWQILDTGENRFLVHSGKDWGERTIALFEPEKQFGVVIFTSGANGRQVISDTLQLLIDDPKLNALVAAEARYEQMQRKQK